MIIHLLSTLGAKYPNTIQGLHAALTEDPVVNKLIRDNLELVFYNRSYLGKLIGFKKQVTKSPPDIFHGHGIWQLPVHQMVNVAHKLDLPYVISPHGMLKKWSLEQHRAKKFLALHLYQRRDLDGAACLQATASFEADELRDLGFKNPIAVIPNGIPLHKFPEKNYNEDNQEKTVLFLSRIVENKGVKELIRAWSKLPKDVARDWRLKIVGIGERGYIKQLNDFIIHKGLEKAVRIEGPLYGSEKIQAYQQASLFVLPTYSENFGIVVAEALACGTPVITTRGAPWSDLQTHNCGWWIEKGVGPLLKTLENSLGLSEETLNQMGKRGRQLIVKKYSIDAVARQMHELYDWILNNHEKPRFVTC